MNNEFGRHVFDRPYPIQVPSRRPLLICFSHLRWNFVWQRPQHLLQRAASSFDVVFFEEPIVKPREAPGLDIRLADGIKVAVPVLPNGLSEDAIVQHQRALLDSFLATARRPAVLWYYTPMALPFSRHVAAEMVVYDNMDELSAFRGASRAMLSNESELLRRADLVFTGGLSLFEAKRHRHANMWCFPSSIDASHFGVARRFGGKAPDDQVDIPGPRLGYFGVIDERLDLSLLDGMASLRPHWQFVMIGPVAKIDPGLLPKRPNIHWLGQKAYRDLPAYLAGWEAGLMPFALNEATRFISPTKTPEFLAAGLPLVSTPIADVVRPYGQKGLVELATTAQDFVTRAEAAMANRTPAWVAEVDRHLAGNSWDETWAEMNRLISAGLQEPGASAAGAAERAPAVLSSAL